MRHHFWKCTYVSLGMILSGCKAAQSDIKMTIAGETWFRLKVKPSQDETFIKASTEQSAHLAEDQKCRIVANTALMIQGRATRVEGQHIKVQLGSIEIPAGTTLSPCRLLGSTVYLFEPDFLGVADATGAQPGAAGAASTGSFHPTNMSETFQRMPDNGPGLGSYRVEFGLKWARPRVVERMQELAKRVFAKTGLPLYLGDMSNSAGGNSGYHVEHLGGLDVDIGVMGNTGNVFCSTIWEKCYSRAAARILVETAYDMGGVYIIYNNDPYLIAEYPGKVKWIKGHDNHLHIGWK